MRREERPAGTRSAQVEGEAPPARAAPGPGAGLSPQPRWSRLPGRGLGVAEPPGPEAAQHPGHVSRKAGGKARSRALAAGAGDSPPLARRDGGRQLPHVGREPPACQRGAARAGPRGEATKAPGSRGRPCGRARPALAQTHVQPQPAASPAGRTRRSLQTLGRGRVHTHAGRGRGRPRPRLGAKLKSSPSRQEGRGSRWAGRRQAPRAAARAFISGEEPRLCGALFLYKQMRAESVGERGTKS